MQWHTATILQLHTCGRVPVYCTQTAAPKGSHSSAGKGRRDPPLIRDSRGNA